MSKLNRKYIKNFKIDRKWIHDYFFGKFQIGAKLEYRWY